MLRAALNLHPEHPEIVFRRDALLMSINDRLGALVSALAPYREAGADFTPLSGAYVDELIRFGAANAEDQEEALEESRDRDHAG